MPMRGENWRFWTPVALMAALAVYSTQKLVRSHFAPPPDGAPRYAFSTSVIARRGSIFSSFGKPYPFAKSVPYWEYRLDPVNLTNAVVRPKGEKVRRERNAIVKTIADTLGLEYRKVLAMADSSPRRGWRDQFLALSSDSSAYRTLSNRKIVAGVAIRERQVRDYIHGRSLCHVLGGLNAEDVPTSGIEQRFDSMLSGTPGTVQGMRDANGMELYDKRQISIAPIPGADVYLTIDHNVQYEAEHALKWGVNEFSAGSGWCIVMDARTAAVLAMASLPDFEPLAFGRATDSQKKNRCIAFNYEPGSVMKTITAAAAFDAGFARPGTLYRTNRDDPDYYRLPGDGSHVWEPRMTIRDAIVHSSNIVMGKLAYDFGPLRLYPYLRRFGFGSRTGVELPGEETGILPDPRRRMWDKASQSRAGIGQFLSVTAIQLCGAYQAIANDGVRMRPHIVEKVVAHDGTVLYRGPTEPAGRAVSAAAAKAVRDAMLDVASPRGTARRAAVRGYSVAGKTGTAQKHAEGAKGYLPGLYRASFCGIVPASDPRIVVLVTLDFDRRTPFHQGGNSAGPVFRRLAKAVLRYLMVPPDRPDELEDAADDEYEKIADERAGAGSGT